MRNELLGQIDENLFAQLPWIPAVYVANSLYMDHTLTGTLAAFVQFFYPWAARTGAP